MQSVSRIENALFYHTFMLHEYNTYTADDPLFKRNPVCGLCWRICTELSEEWGGQINFDLLGSMETADRLCKRLIASAWALGGVEYYYHWLEGQLAFSLPAITCATATVCLSLRLMDGLPEPLQQLASDMRGLLRGEGYELYDNMRSEAWRQDICISPDTYGEIPEDPNYELKIKNDELAERLKEQIKENEQLQYQLQNMSKHTPQTVNNFNIAGNYIAEQNIDIHDNTNCTIYATEAPNKEDVPQLDKEKETNGTAAHHFALLTAQCVKEGKAEIVEAELRSAAKGSAHKLVQCIRTNEALGYLDTKNMSSTELFNELNRFFGLGYKLRNFTRYREQK